MENHYFETVTDNFTFPKEDADWINFIYQYLIRFHNELTEDNEFKDKSENQITDDIYFWLINLKEFTKKITVTSEPKTDNIEIEGYYDLKFQSPLWNGGQTHFAIENKILKDRTESYKEYIYKPIGNSNRKYDNGGMFRFLSNKYADKEAYGGMLAFIKQDNISAIADQLKDKVKALVISDNNKQYGKLINEKLLETNIQGFENSFQTNHIRKDGTEIHLYHLLFQFN